MGSDGWTHVGVMALTFGLALTPALPGRRMESGDFWTFIVLVAVTSGVAVLPGMLTWGINQNSATYLLGALLIVVVATVSHRFPAGSRPEAGRAAPTAGRGRWSPPLFRPPRGAG
jgi:hypothetical protein